MCASRIVILFKNLVCSILIISRHALSGVRSTDKKNVLVLVVGVLQEKRHACTWRMLNVCSKERSLEIVIQFYLLLVVVVDRDLFV